MMKKKLLCNHVKNLCMVRKSVSSASETVPYISVEDIDDSNLYGRPESRRL